MSLQKKVKQLEASISDKLLGLMLDRRLVAISEKRTSDVENQEFQITRPSLLAIIRMLVSPTFWVPESYCKGDWKLTKGDLANFLINATSVAPRRYAKYLKCLRCRPQISHWIKQKIFTRYFTRKVVQHYDIDAELYKCFLDDEMVYTCAFYDSDNNLAQAQLNKFETIYSRLELKNNSGRILNIGCGWGGFERFLVQRSKDILVDGLSISTEQIKWANNRNRAILQPNEADRISLINEDYVDFNRGVQYDAITAIGMVEHVGLSCYSEFFNKCFELLKVNGTLLVHMIVKQVSAWPTNSWIDRYIFPGGYTPSVSELTKGAEYANLLLKNIHMHHPSNYAQTLQAWRSNLYESKERMLSLYTTKHGLTIDTAEYLFRQWEMYLAGSEFAFRVEAHPLQVAHFVFTKNSTTPV